MQNGDHGASPLRAPWSPPLARRSRSIAGGGPIAADDRAASCSMNAASSSSTAFAAVTNTPLWQAADSYNVRKPDAHLNARRNRSCGQLTTTLTISTCCAVLLLLLCVLWLVAGDGACHLTIHLLARSQVEGL
jgi:hypothetical protein